MIDSDSRMFGLKRTDEWETRGVLCAALACARVAALARLLNAADDPAAMAHGRLPLRRMAYSARKASRRAFRFDFTLASDESLVRLVSS